MITKFVYRDESINLVNDLSVTSEAATISATTYAAVAGGFFSIQIPNSITAGTLTIQGNNSNPWLKNSFVGRNGTGASNPSFSANWQTLSTMTNNFSTFNIPVRWVRISGSGVHINNFVAHLWTDQCGDGS